MLLPIGIITYHNDILNQLSNQIISTDCDKHLTKSSVSINNYNQMEEIEMKWTSLGFHTFIIFVRLSREQATLIKEAFRELMLSGEIKIIPYGEVPFWVMNEGDAYLKNRPAGYNITYNTKLSGIRKGIKWTLRISSSSKDFKEYTLEAQINPKILAGIIDYITAATKDDIKDIASLFNQEAQRISLGIPMFDQFQLKRVDYCINFHLLELGIPSSTDQTMRLFKRSNIPHNYNKVLFYNPIGRRMGSDDSSLYLKSKSVTIQCYDKYSQLQREYPDSPSLENARNILRFEVQCYYRKVYGMRRSYKDNLDPLPYNEFKEFFSKETCESVIRNYFDRVIMRGDYYPIKHSRNLILKCGFRGNRGQRMIDTLNLVNPSRGGGGIHNAKSILTGIELDNFKRGLLDLQTTMGINPVAIPSDWGIKHIPNLLDAYDKLSGNPTRSQYITAYDPHDDEI